ncbi:hypothetical protein [Streptomyces sp. NPDC051109]
MPIAAVMIEPINGTTGGAFVPPDGYLRLSTNSDGPESRTDGPH